MFIPKAVSALPFWPFHVINWGIVRLNWWSLMNTETEGHVHLLMWRGVFPKGEGDRAKPCVAVDTGLKLQEHHWQILVQITFGFFLRHL